MKKTIIAIMCMSTIALFSPVIFADADDGSTSPYKEVKEKMKNMSKEDKKAMMDNAKAKWNSMSDADKQAFRDKVKNVAEKRKSKLEKKCEEMRENNGEMIYIKIYAMDLMKQGKSAK